MGLLKPRAIHLWNTTRFSILKTVVDLMIWMMAQVPSGINGVICSLVSGAGQAAECFWWPTSGRGGQCLSFTVILKPGTEPGLRKGSVNMAIITIVSRPYINDEQILLCIILCRGIEKPGRNLVKTLIVLAPVWSKIGQEGIRHSLKM